MRQRLVANLFGFGLGMLGATAAAALLPSPLDLIITYSVIAVWIGAILIHRRVTNQPPFSPTKPKEKNDGQP